MNLRLLLVAAAVLGTAAAVAQPADPLQSPACRAALDALQAAESAAATASVPATTARARLAEPRRRAARACLGAGTAGPPPSQRSARAPIAVPPAGDALGRPLPPSVPSTPPAPPPVESPQPIAPPTVILGCDATSCRASDGTVLQRAGTGLIGPRGFCRVEGHTLVCP